MWLQDFGLVQQSSQELFPEPEQRLVVSSAFIRRDMGFFKLSAVFLLSPLNCPRHSSAEYTSPCDRTCANALNPHGHVCTEKAQYTCKCKIGFLAQIGTSGESVQCVKAEECKVTCGPNQHYKACGSGCPPTCEKPKGPIICTTMCSPKCVCDKGYVRLDDKCVLESECKNTHDQPHHA
ncbi:serine protease inhibitor swm-1-like isoform X2 [Bufo bufo]|uniref:serine protease inhibitor swm-1-like isoform X2 n=1 Tax=Bufo bufo TaxID=8384 RepID=UPI001ABDB430|nr:serine protease inhibitor swm-1-like isoform X2 [Bufo bufo]